MTPRPFCQVCEKEVEFAEVTLFLPPHGSKNGRKMCFDCGVKEAIKFNEENDKKTQKITIITRDLKGDNNNETV